MTNSDMNQDSVQRVSALPKPTPRSTVTLPSMENATKDVSKAMSIWIHPFTRLHKIPVFKRLWLYLFFMGIYAGFVNWVADQGISPQLFKEASNAAYMSAVFGLLLVFRTNSAYERWWEGRRLWGQLVNDSRNLALKIRTYGINVPTNDQARLGEQIVSFAYSLKHHLRDTRPTKNLPGVKPIDQIPKGYHLPAHVALKIFETVSGWHQKHFINEFTMLLLDSHLRAFMDICGACERIKSSPLAISYRAFMRQGISLNLLILPWFVAQLDWWFSVPLVMVASYFLIGLELIAEDIEDPFGTDGDDLPLDQICGNIQKTITEILTVDSSTGLTKPDGLDFDPLKYTKSVKALRVDPLKDTLTTKQPDEE